MRHRRATDGAPMDIGEAGGGNWTGGMMPLICAAMDGRGVVQVLLVVFACGALLIRVGMGWYAAGQSRSKNAAGAALRNAADMAVAALCFWAVGGAIMNGDAGLIFDAKGRATSQQLVQLVLVLIATAPFVGAVGERSRFFPMLAPPALLAAVVVPLAARWAWNGGWLQRMGFVDVAGATVIHVAGGLCAAAGAVLLGARTGKYNRDGSSNFIPGHSAPMASVGVMLMLAGWVPHVLAATLLPASATGATASTGAGAAIGVTSTGATATGAAPTVPPTS